MPTTIAPRNGTEQQYLPSVSVDTFGSVGNFDTFSGGDAAATITKHRPGGMGPEIAYTGLPVFSDVTVGRVYEEARDHLIIAHLRLLVGRQNATISVQPLDQDGNPFSTPRVYRGLIASISDGNADSNSTSPRMWTINISVEDVNG